MDDSPYTILLVSGKRKSGKDYLCEKLKSELGDSVSIIHISEPLKTLYGVNNGLDTDELMTHGVYKEQYRLDMIRWSEEIRKQDAGYFCRAACEKAVSKPYWIVVDVRRRTDIEWFTSTYKHKIKIIRINALDDIRKMRGWNFKSGVDDVASECDLDNYANWNLIIDNNSEEECSNGLFKILNLLKS